MKNFLRWFKSGKQHKYVNGGKGVISIFLAILMLPFLTMADFLVEAGRYHEAVSLLDESMDSAALSTLSNYDEYMLDRFGLMSVSQDINIGQTYKKYLDTNIKSMSSWTLPNTKVTGKYALSDADVLLQQIGEVSKFSAPTALAGDIMVSDLIVELEKMTKITNIFSLVSSAGDAADSMLTLVEGMDELIKNLLDLKKHMGEYDQNYKTLETKVKELVQALKREKAAQETIDSLNQQINSLESSKAGASDAEISRINSQIGQLNSQLDAARNELKAAQDEVNQKRSECKEAKKNYMQSVKTCKEDLEKYKKLAQELIEKATDFITSVGDVAVAGVTAKKDNKLKQDEQEKKIKEYDVKIRDAETQAEKEDLQRQKTEQQKLLEDMKNEGGLVADAAEGVQNGANDYVNKLKEEVDEFDANTVQNSIDELDKKYKNLDAFNIDSITSTYQWDGSRYYVRICKLISVMVLQEIVRVAQEEIEESSFMDIVGVMSTIFRSMFSIQGIYDTRLCAFIAESTGHTPGEIDVILNDIGDYINYADSIANDNISVFTKIWKCITEYFKCLIQITIHLVDYLVGMVTRTITAVKQLFSSGDKILLNEYLIKTLSNRSDMENDSTMGGSNSFTGYSFSDVNFAKCGKYDALPGIGQLTTMIDLLKNSAAGGSDLMLCGAEVEYIIAGSRSEMANQIAVFFNLYMMRLLVDAYPVFKNAEVKLISTAVGAATCGIGKILVLVLYILIEPLVDAILIVNGHEISLKKKCIYLTPSGLPTLFSRLQKLGLENYVDLQAEANKAFKTSGTKATEDEGIVNWKYEDYLFVQMLINCDIESSLRRFQTIVTMESKAHYGGDAFNINDTYTYVDAEVSGSYNPILPLGNMSVNGIFSMTRRRARGY